MTKTVLIADDDASIRTVLERAVKRHGLNAFCTGDGKTLLQWVEDGKGDAVVTDVMMPFDGKEANSFDWLPHIRMRRPELPVIVISARNTLNTAVKANAVGAYDYLPKPFDLDALMACLDRCLALPQPVQKSSSSVLNLADKSASLVGSSPAMQALYRILARVVGVDLTIMIKGESGTGKELVARAIHDLSPRAKRPFVAINMAAIPKELAESELFGHEKGAFTGAVMRKSGKFEQAEGGTLFLDEIGDMPIEMQSKLLRVLQEGEYTPIGSARGWKTNVRIICATHRNMNALVKAGEFREDLFYRLNVVPVELPPLRERKEDINALINHFLQRAVTKGLEQKTISLEAAECLHAYDWPGNIREMENIIYRLCTLTSGQVIDMDALTMHTHITNADEGRGNKKIKSLEQYIAECLKIYFEAHEGALPAPGIYAEILPLMERPLIIQALQACNGNQLRAAQLLGMNRNTLRKRMAELGIGKA